MIISHQHRFVFVKNMKTAGTSIEVFLSPHCGPDDVFTPIWPVEPGHQPRHHDGFYNHMPAAEIRAALGDARWSGYFTFTVERNPWDKTVSHFHMERHRSGGRLDWATYMRDGTMIATHHFYTDPASGEVLVDRVLRYERLDDELGAVFARLGIEWAGTLPVRAKAGYRPAGRHYRDYYNRAQRDRVARAFAWEIEHFGYEF